MRVCGTPGATVGGHKSRPSWCRMLSAAGVRSTWRAVGLARLPLQLPFTRPLASAASAASAAPKAAAAAPAAPAAAEGAPHQDLLQSLSEEQLAAATTESPRARVIAGPGSGKTRVIAARVLHLLQQQQVDPRQVLVITFTNKARGELQDRLQSALPPATAKKLYISTFHGLAYDILRKNPSLVQQLWSDQHKRLTGRPLAFPQQQDQKVVKILNEKEAKAIQEQILGGKEDKSTEAQAASSSSSEAVSSSSAGRKTTRALSSSSSSRSSLHSLTSAAAVSSSDDEQEVESVAAKANEVKKEQKALKDLISKMKNFGSNVSKCTGEQLLVQMEEQGLRKFKNLNASLKARLAAQYDEYVLLLAREGLVDLDDLLCHTVHILQHHPELLERWQRRYRHVLVDESQDTNSSQWELVKLLAGDNNHLFMVGDPHQGIYEFRGASPKHLSDSFKQWAGPQGATMWLRDNYRSRKAIVSSALHMLHGRPAKDVQAKRMDKAGQASVEVVLAPTQQQEVQAIVRTMWQQHEAGRRWQDMTVLLRSNRQAEQLQEELVLNSIPCQLIGGADLWTRGEVQLAVAAAQLVATGGTHLPAVLRLVKELPVCKGLKHARVQELQDAWWPVQMEAQVAPSNGSRSNGSSSSSSNGPEPGAVQAITMCEALFEGCLVPGEALPLDVARQLVKQQQGLTLSDLLPQQLRDEVEKVYKDRGLAFGEEWESTYMSNGSQGNSRNGSSRSSSSSSSSSSSLSGSPQVTADKAAAVAAAAAVQEHLEELAPPWQPSHPEVAKFGKTKPRRAALQRLRGLLQLGAALAEVAPPAEALKVLFQVSGVLDWAAKQDLDACAPKKKGRPGRIRRLQHVLRLATRGNCYRVMPPDLQEPLDGEEEGDDGGDGGARQLAAAAAILNGGPDMPGLGSLQQFVAYASLMADNTDTESEAAKEEGDGRVQLMTLHASKGKEFPMVVIPNVVDGSLPSGRSETNAEIQQERNLFYVGMTRAEDLLLVTAHMQVSNSWRGTTGGPSAFLEPLLDKGDAAGVRVRMIEDW